MPASVLRFRARHTPGQGWGRDRGRSGFETCHYRPHRSSPGIEEARPRKVDIWQPSELLAVSSTAYIIPVACLHQEQYREVYAILRETVEVEDRQSSKRASAESGLVNVHNDVVVDTERFTILTNQKHPWTLETRGQ